MKLKIFGKLTDIFNGNEYDFPLQDAIIISELKVKLEEIFPELETSTYLVVKNGAKAEGYEMISENTEIALLPPYSGG